MQTLNPLLLTDVYKTGHMIQYPSNTTKIYSYLHTRSDKKFNEIVVYGLRYLLKEYLTSPITTQQANEFLEYNQQILGKYPSPDIRKKIYDLRDLGYIPLEIKSFPEGTILPAKSVIATVTNTHPDFYWVVGFFESLLLHAWYPITVASASRSYWKLVKHFAEMTCDNDLHIPFAVHDFGYRGVTSEESAMVAGSAHLIHFLGTDTIPALKFIDTYYKASPPVGLSVSASEHSTMTCYGQENELKAFERMLDVYQTGIVSIVSDGYDIYNACTTIMRQLKDRILSRDGKVVIRPDSGFPLHILCGNPNAPDGSNAYKGVFKLLEEVFGSSINSKGYKVLNSKIGVIYGDGMTYSNFSEILSTMTLQGWASSNLVIGVGGLLLQSHSRDDLAFSFKATYAEIDGKPVNIFKDPITDHKKKSMTGLIKCSNIDDQYIFEDKQTWEQESQSILRTTFKNGKLMMDNSWENIKTIAKINIKSIDSPYEVARKKVN